MARSARFAVLTLGVMFCASLLLAGDAHADSARFLPWKEPTAPPLALNDLFGRPRTLRRDRRDRLGERGDCEHRAGALALGPVRPDLRVRGADRAREGYAPDGRDARWFRRTARRRCFSSAGISTSLSLVAAVMVSGSVFTEAAQGADASVCDS